MLDKLIDEYTKLLDKDPLDQVESTDIILRRFAKTLIEQTIKELNQDKYYGSVK